MLNYYSKIIEFIMVSYNNKSDKSLSIRRNCWIIPISSSKDEIQKLYSRQIIRPSRSMNTESKFKFINSILNSEKKGEPTLHNEFNRFEQQKFIEKFDTKNDEIKDQSVLKDRPLFIQFMEQVDYFSIEKLKVQGETPFRCKLTGENAIDAGGPGRELFSSLIT